MENTTNAMQVMDDNNSFIADLTSGQSVFCSIDPKSKDEKALLFNAMNNPEKRMGDCINMTIYVKDLFCEIVDCVNRDTGEVTKCPRIVAIDKDGIGYVAVSIGVFNSFKKIIGIYGAPTWDEPIPIEIKQVSKGDRKMLTFIVK